MGKITLKQRLKNNPFTRFVIYFFKLIYSVIKFPCCRHSKEIEKFKGIHRGERCFIVATGPSLTLHDCELLENEITFSCNSIVKLFDKTRWRPTYYVVSDVVPYEACKDLIKINDFENVFYSKKIDRKNKGVCHFALNPVNVYRCELTDNFKDRIFPSKKLNRYFNDSPSVVFSIIQLAIYMGFSKIYLLGQDCNFAGKRHSSIVEISYKKMPLIRDGEKIIETFKSYKYALTKNFQIEIYNVTRGGALECFARKKLEDVLDIN